MKRVFVVPRVVVALCAAAVCGSAYAEDPPIPASRLAAPLQVDRGLDYVPVVPQTGEGGVFLSSHAMRGHYESALSRSGGADTESGVGLARLLLAGEGGPADTERAELLLKDAFRRGAAEAGTILGEFLLQRIGREQEGVSLLQSAFRQGSAEAGISLADFLGFEQRSDREGILKVVETLLRGKASASPDDANVLADYLRDEGTPAALKEAVQWYEKASAAGSARAAFWLAQLGEQSGAPTPQVEQLYDLAAKRGYLQAARALARSTTALGSYWRDRLLASGDLITELDISMKAAALPEDRLRAAAAVSDKASVSSEIATADLVSLAKRFASGTDAPKDEGRAIGLFTRAADQGSEIAALELATMVVNRSVYLDDDAATVGAAFQRIKELADRGSKRAALILGDMFLNGIGSSVDRAAAIHWYKAAAKSSTSVDAMLRLAVAYLRVSDQSSYEEARVWLENAGSHGSATADLMLARGFASEDWIGPDANSSTFWYEKAIDAGQVSTAGLLAEQHLRSDAPDALERAKLVFTSRLEGPNRTRILIAYASFLAAHGGQAEAVKILNTIELNEAPDAILELYHIKGGRQLPGATSSTLLRRALSAARKGTSVELAVAKELLHLGRAADAHLALDVIATDAELGLSGAARALSEAYENGVGTIKNSERALRALEDGVGLGDPDACLALAQQYASGPLVSPNLDRAQSLFRAALRMDLTNPDANFGLAKALLSGGPSPELNQREAAALIHLAATAGHTAAQIEMATMYEWGNGVPRTPEKAEAWYKSAASSGSTTALLALANFYSSGLNTKPRPREAFDLTFSAAEKGDPVAMIEVGKAMIDGNGTSPDVTGGLNWLERAAAAGSSDAMLELFTTLSEGERAPADASLAEHWLKSAAESGNDRAMYRLAIRAMDQDGIIKDPEALAWLQRAASLGNNQSKKLIKKMSLSKKTSLQHK